MLIWLFLTFSSFLKVDAAYLRWYTSYDNYVETPLTSPLDILNHVNNTDITINHKTVVYTFGFTASPNDTTMQLMKNAYIEYRMTDFINFVMLDWEEEASIGEGGLLVDYATSAVDNTKKIGEQLGNSLLNLSSHGLKLDKVHLIGHSLGAHLMAYAGRVTQQKNKPIGRITGLDPAGPLFSGIGSLPGLQESDAEFVVGVHTNRMKYGTPNRVGHVDVWVNCDLDLQPGCKRGISPLLSENDRCSHDRAQIYYAESLGSPSAFPAIKANNCNAWISMENNTKREIIYIGENTNTEARGNFYLRTNSVPPFGKGLNGTEP